MTHCLHVVNGGEGSISKVVEGTDHSLHVKLQQISGVPVMSMRDANRARKADPVGETAFRAGGLQALRTAWHEAFSAPCALAHHTDMQPPGAWGIMHAPRMRL